MYRVHGLIKAPPRADLLMQMPHPEEDKVVKYPTKLMPGGGGGGEGYAQLELTEP